MRKRLLAWLLVGVMASSMAPMDALAAEKIQGIGTNLEAANSEGEQGAAGNLNSGEAQNPGGNQNPEGNQNPGGSQSPGEEQNPGDSQSPGEEQDPGGEQNPGGSQDPGGEQDPGDSLDPGEEQDPGGNQDPEEVQDPEGNEGNGKEPQKKPGINEGALPLPSTDTEEPKDGEGLPGDGAVPLPGERNAVTEEGEGAEFLLDAEGGVDAQSQEYLEGWGVPLDGMDIKYLEVPKDILARAKELDAVSPEFLNSKLGIGIEARGSQKYDSSWDVYSSNYIYNHLTVKQKRFWDTLDYVCNQYLTKDLDAIPYSYAWNEYSCAEWKVMYGRMGLTEEMARNLFIMFAYSNPQYYFLDSSALPRNSNGEWVLFFYGKFSNGSARRTETSRVKAQINAMKKKVAKGKTDVEKARIAHDLIIQKVKYDHTYNTYYPQTLYHQSAYSVLCEGYTVCAGYSKAFELLMNAVGVDTMAVTSTTHAWNMVRINDSWYQVDCTWDDKDGANGYEGVYTYFCRKTSRIAGDLDQNNFHQLEYFYNKKVPKCTLDSGATLTSIGTYKAPASQVKRPSVSTKKVSGGMQVTIKTATSGASIYYTLDGKTPSPSFSKCYRYTKPFKVSSNVTVKAVAVQNRKWDSSVRSVKVNGKMCTVKFNAMGGNKVSSKKVHYNTTVKKPSAKRSGYKLVGWYTDKACRKVWNFKKKVTKNMTLYAKWERR